MQVKRNEVGSYTPIYLLSVIVFCISAISSVVFLISNGSDSTYVSTLSIITTIIKVLIDIIAVVVFVKALIISKTKSIKNGVYLTLFYTVSLITSIIEEILFMLEVNHSLGSFFIDLILPIVKYIPTMIFVSSYFKRPSKMNKALSIISVVINTLLIIFGFVSAVRFLKYALISSLLSIIVYLLSIAINIMVCKVIIKAYSINEVNYAISGSTEDRSAIDEVQFLKSQLDNGVITQEEFDKKKKELLNL